MQVYLVGGAVRDRLLGRVVSERDWVVVGASPAELERAGYLPVGRDFPVFLHPDTKEEHALARLERKVGPGYRGFTTEFSPDVTLEDDLKRRDLTINAMAEDAGGHVIDPLRRPCAISRRACCATCRRPSSKTRCASCAWRVSPRAMRRWASASPTRRWSSCGAWWTTARPARSWPSGSGRKPKRRWASRGPEVFIEVLRECGALKRGVPRDRRAVRRAAAREVASRSRHRRPPAARAARTAVNLGGGVAVRFAVLMHDLGKGITPADVLPSHHGHEDAGVALVEQLCARLRVPESPARARRSSRPGITRMYTWRRSCAARRC